MLHIENECKNYSKLKNLTLVEIITENVIMF